MCHKGPGEKNRSFFTCWVARWKSKTLPEKGNGKWFGFVFVLFCSVVCLNAHVQICVALKSQSFLNHTLTKERESRSDRTCSLQVAFVPEKDTLPQTLWLCSTGRSSPGREFTPNSHCQVKCLLWQVLLLGQNHFGQHRWQLWYKFSAYSVTKSMASSITGWGNATGAMCKSSLPRGRADGAEGNKTC